MIGAPSATVLAVLVATWLVWQVRTAVLDLVIARRVVAGYVRDRLAARRLRKKWARLRSQHPKEF